MTRCRILSVTLALALGLGLGAGAAMADLSTGLIAHYPFDGNVADASANGNHGSIVGALVSTTDRYGAPNTAYEFNGTNTYVHVPSSASLSSPTNQITMCAWVLLYGNSKVGSPFSPILMKSTDPGNGFMYRMLVSTSYFGAAYINWNLTQTTGVTVYNQWAHLATTYDGVKHRFYLNGAARDSVPLGITMTADFALPITLAAGGLQPGCVELRTGGERCGSASSVSRGAS